MPRSLIAFFVKRARRLGRALIRIDRVLLRSLPLAQGWNELLGCVRQDFSLDLQYREFIMLRVAVLNHARFEWDVHYPAYLAAGGREEKATAVQKQGVSSVLTKRNVLSSL